MKLSSQLLFALENIYDSPLITHLKKTITKYPEAPWVSILHKNQILSKKWLLDELQNHTSKKFEMTFILGGWCGLLPAMAFERKECPFIKIRSFDIDKTCAPIAENLNRKWVTEDWRFKASTIDMLKITYPYFKYSTLKSNNSLETLNESPDLIINTNCEHLANFSTWFKQLPVDTPLVLQSNNLFDEPQHVNCVKTLKEFQDQVPLKKTLFAGELDLKQYKRFMLIGSL